MPLNTRTAGPKTKRLARERLHRLLFESRMEDEEELIEVARRQVPDAWHVVEADMDVEKPKEKVTLYIDRSVVKVLRAMGKGYRARINRILATWVQMKIADLKAEETEYFNKLEVTFAETDAPEPEDNRKRRRETLEQHWAYAQGLRDAEAIWSREA